MRVVYEDNHIIIVYKESGEIVQGDKTGDTPLSEIVKSYIKEKYQKPGAVFLGVVHRLDRPVSGLVVFARTSKALTRLNKMFAGNEVHKTYWAIVQENGNKKQESADGEWHTLEHWLVRNEQQNKSYAYDHEVPHSKKATLRYQIRCQLSTIGLPIKGDLKYGARRSNPDGSISLLSRHVEFIHPVSKEPVVLDSPLPDDPLWTNMKLIR